jgi:hypothetical protein
LFGFHFTLEKTADWLTEWRLTPDIRTTDETYHTLPRVCDDVFIRMWIEELQEN